MLKKIAILITCFNFLLGFLPFGTHPEPAVVGEEKRWEKRSQEKKGGGEGCRTCRRVIFFPKKGGKTQSNKIS
jgi:hypothetical protein